MKYYIVTILIKGESFGYSPGQLIQIPVHARSEHFARNKVINRCNGSEYPYYSIISVERCDNGLFPPIITKK